MQQMNVMSSSKTQGTKCSFFEEEIKQFKNSNPILVLNWDIAISSSLLFWLRACLWVSGHPGSLYAKKNSAIFI